MVAESVQTETSAAQGSVLLIGCFVFTALVNYAFAILMSWLLPVHEFGIVGVAQAVMLLGGTVMSAGFPWALTRHVAALPGEESTRAATRLALIGNVLVGLAFGGVVYGVTARGSGEFGEYGQVMLLAAATVEMLAISSVFVAALRGVLRFRAAAIVLSIEVVVKLLVSGALVLLGQGAVGAVAGFVAGAAVSALVALVAAGGVPLRAHTDGRGLGELNSSVTPLFVSMCGLAALLYGDTIGVKLFSPAANSDEVAGYYQAAVTLSRIPVFVTIALCGVIFSYLARYRAARNQPLTTYYASSLVRYATLFIIPINLVLMVIPDQVIRTFYSAKYDASAQPLRFAALGAIMLVFVQVFTTMLQTTDSLRWAMIVLPAAVAVEIGALAVLVPLYGAVGAGLAVAVAGAFALCFLAPLAIRVYNLRLSARGKLATPLTLAVPAAALYLLPHGGRVTTVLTVLVAGALYVATLIAVNQLQGRDFAILASGFGRDKSYLS